MAAGLNAAKYSGHGILPIDMSPNYAGAIVGMASTAGNFIGFLAPYTAGVLTDGQVREVGIWSSPFKNMFSLFPISAANNSSMAKGIPPQCSVHGGGDAVIGFVCLRRHPVLQ